MISESCKQEITINAVSLKFIICVMPVERPRHRSHAPPAVRLLGVVNREVESVGQEESNILRGRVHADIHVDMYIIQYRLYTLHV